MTTDSAENVDEISFDIVTLTTTNELRSTSGPSVQRSTVTATVIISNNSVSTVVIIPAGMVDLDRGLNKFGPVG